MNHRAVEQFWECYNALPLTIQKIADNNFAIIKQHPKHPLLRLSRAENLVSMRIGSRYRALALEEENRTIWFWIGTYKEYKKMVD